ncbi:MAG: HipA domain-containing protein [Bacteroidota bacterium]
MTGGTQEFHPACSKKFFGSETPPILDITSEQMQELAKDIVLRSVTVTGVQPKLSLSIDKIPNVPKKSRFTIVGLWGHYILKPATPQFSSLPENEDLTMHLSDFFGIPTANHSLIRLKSGELAYITKRFDRIGDEKLALEDMCQLTETLTSDKYHSSMEKIGKEITNYSDQPGLDVIHFFELSLFCYLTGNADMHLKNFSLLTDTDNKIIFSPAYDLLCTKIAMPDDKEEMALTVNGRKNKIKRSDFDTLGKNLNIPDKTILNTYSRFAERLKEVNEWIDISFLPGRMKKAYTEVIHTTATKMGL